VAVTWSLAFLICFVCGITTLVIEGLVRLNTPASSLGERRGEEGRGRGGRNGLEVLQQHKM